MVSKEFFAQVDVLAEDKGITREQVLSAFRDGLSVGCRKTFDVRSCRVEFIEEKNEILLYKQYYVYDDKSEDLSYLQNQREYTMLSLTDAKKLNKRAKAEELLEIKVDPKDFTITAAKDFKNRFHEELTKAQKETIYQYFKGLEEEMVIATVIDVDDRFYRLDVGKDMTTLLPKKEALPGDNFNVGDRIKVYITDVEMKTKWPKIYVSRIHTSLITRLFEDLIPEIKDGIIDLVGISRDPGDRSKIGVRSNDPKVDPIGACVGEGGTRIREIVNALSGEKIDLFRWSDNEKDLIANALQPSRVVGVVDVNPRDKSAIAIVPDDQLSLAIGKAGQNVKLAVQATGWSIDIKSESQAAGEGIIY